MVRMGDHSTMEKLPKLRFKRGRRETGLAGCGNPYPSVDIKSDGKVVGRIDPPNWRTPDNLYRIRLALRKEITPTDPAPFRWVTLKAKHASEEAARGWLETNWAAINRDLELHRFED